MPGICGFAGNSGGQSSENLVVAMAAALQDNTWQPIDTYAGHGIGLGRVHFGYRNGESQPIWNEDQSACIVLAGEFYGCHGLRQELLARGHRFLTDGDGEVALHLFEEEGTAFVRRLNGSFAGAIWQPAAQQLVLFNDHLGSRPLYVATHCGRLLFASGLRGLLADPTLPRDLDHVAIAQLLSFEYMLDMRTYLRKVVALAPATILTFSPSGMSGETYWRLAFATRNEPRSMEELLDGLVTHMAQAVERQAPGALPAGINLSGGLDSRAVLAFMGRTGLDANQLYTYTFGIPGCDDAQISEQLARVAGSNHQFLELKPDYLLEAATEGVRLTDGMKSCAHMHAIATIREQAKAVRVLYTGYLLDALSVPCVAGEQFAYYDDETAIRLIREDISTLFPGVEPAEMYVDSFARGLEPEFTDALRSTVMASKDPLYANWHNNFELYHRQRRFTLNGNELLRGYVLCRTPFIDKDLMSYSLAMPIGLRYDRYWLKQVLARHARELAKVPWEKTGYPLVENMRGLMKRIDSQSRWYLRHRGFNWVPIHQHRPYADYDGWMRTALRPWVETTLLSPRALERGIVQPAFMRKLVAEHMAGANHARELGMLLSMELWFEMFLD